MTATSLEPTIITEVVDFSDPSLTLDKIRVRLHVASLFGNLPENGQGFLRNIQIGLEFEPFFLDETPPTCELLPVNPGPPASVQVRFQDDDSGLAAIVVVLAENATVVIPDFCPGTTEPVLVTATKVNQSLPAIVRLVAADAHNNCIDDSDCDMSM